jgi:ribonuclease HI
MSPPQPDYLLFCTARRASDRGQWRFVLRPAEGGAQLEAADWEPETSLERLELLAVVRGLEALDRPARVTLVTSSRSLASGFNFGLAEWRASGWQWERFGALAPIKHADLWQRVDQALSYHQVQCRTLRTDAASRVARPHYASRPGFSDTTPPARAARRPGWWAGLGRTALGALAWLGGRPARREPSWAGVG